MELQEKLKILSDSAKYDVSCSSSGGTRKNIRGGIGNSHMSGICHSWADDGRCISLLKILLTNCCIYDCVYCVNRVTNDVPRAQFTPDEIVNLTIEFYRRNYIEGLFLSSAIIKNPDYTMELMLQVVKNLREENRFNGYIHMKAIPGADSNLIAQAGLYADRMSVNIELPSEQGLKLLAPQKKKEAIIRPMNFIHNQIGQKAEEKKLFKKSPLFVPAGQSTQLIIGATPDRDLNILRLSEGLYKKFNLKRVYYSAYVPVSSHPNLPSISNPPMLREHRLYQADWLLRYYGFSASELLNEEQPDFDTGIDPKANWAIRNLQCFPIEVNKADYSMLLRVPGIGVRSAIRIVQARRMKILSYENLKKIGVVLKRARFFITCNGKYYNELGFNENIIRQALVGDAAPKLLEQRYNWEQLSMFSTGV